MKQSKTITNFTKMNDAQFEAHALGVAATMKDNAHFPDPSPALADLNTSIQLFSAALADTKTRDIVKILIKNKTRQDLQLLLHELSNYCNHIAKGDRAILASTGFSLNAESNSTQALSFPENFNVQPGNNSGEALLYINTVKNARSYLFLYGPFPVTNDAWLHAGVNSLPYFTIKGLVPGTTYSFKMAAAGSKGQLLYTDTISKMIV